LIRRKAYKNGKVITYDQIPESFTSFKILVRNLRAVSMKVKNDSKFMDEKSMQSNAFEKSSKTKMESKSPSVKLYGTMTQPEARQKI
jgi:hypothetical protein